MAPIQRNWLKNCELLFYTCGHPFRIPNLKLHLHMKEIKKFKIWKAIKIKEK